MPDEPKPRQMLSRAQMEAVIAEGGSVLLPGGRLIAKAADIPPEAELALAAQDPARQAVAADELDRQIAELQARRASLAAKPVEETLSTVDTHPAEAPPPAETPPLSTVDSPKAEAPLPEAAPVSAVDSPHPVEEHPADEPPRFGRRR